MTVMLRTMRAVFDFTQFEESSNNLSYSVRVTSKLFNSNKNVMEIDICFQCFDSITFELTFEVIDCHVL